MKSRTLLLAGLAVCLLSASTAQAGLFGKKNKKAVTKITVVNQAPPVQVFQVQPAVQFFQAPPVQVFAPPVQMQFFQAAPIRAGY